ncbi:Acyl-ACP thioesterase (FatA) [Fructobacillus fructosus]|uniref:acyl-[acyl-carrier-protein] thioesterase n=1 Tax=Fructobacillus fructosus TaxID=1631 RepID=UPI0002195722|nr:acyl-ACP thioesterase domain-containing protein [Fructobacillus fructosus]KRN52412.1 Acyl-ACP thioesterase [Fructobacillus fructosus KCTC 3544]CAK1239443.1 Acyl-ACP thioesterase (FatA) [Fructobacillus fructosus]CAK1240099.1 Acyl-ACP thioesterase (FatA) [Fructobacillus fructosus]CAK1240738.1 Acyl-ACP thioesterase (FatA) [Fructobacillus fructosus]CAK1242279.1 Acyl-ACP thioesterase (FatA) [Fructobacillus fructosus]
MANIYSIQRPVEYYQVDLTRKLSLSMILNLAILCSRKQGEYLKVGYQETDKWGLGWVILQYDVKILRRPVLGEELTIETKAGEWSSYFAQRGFYFKDAAGKVIIDIDSLWALIDLEKRHMVKLPLELVKPYGGNEQKRLPKMVRIPKIKDEPIDFDKPYQVRFLDIDGNRHVNNSKYLEWMVDVLPLDFLKEHEATGFSIRYENEVHYGHHVDSQVVMGDNETRHRVLNGDQTAAEAVIHWAPADKK